MHLIRQFTFVCALIVVVVFAATSSETKPNACSAKEHMQIPCVCCKKDCWYTIASAAAHELGHLPGEAGEREALATLRLIRACMVNDCSAVCVHRIMF
ncbi:hypothetical protein DICVIV_00406 [Dictyocaulus viviparus]|uniref:Uncharacterized protein n=1 Tax=Dictyocaulus viviparus TaxID=29172 RepID=A0A0D8Y9E5_DICVI|nr:hypothetical protein DICVIV_00406 [Dictyocaulus viviparus]